MASLKGSLAGLEAALSQMGIDASAVPERNDLGVQPFEREMMVKHIAQTLRKSRPNAPPGIASRIPALSQRIEATLYQQARSASEYRDRFTLHERMRAIALSSVTLRAKRQRQTPRNSSCDLVKLHNQHRKKAVLESGPDNRIDKGHVVAECMSSDGAHLIHFSFSSSKTTHHDIDLDSDDEDDDDCDDDYDVEDEENEDEDENLEKVQEFASDVDEVRHCLHLIYNRLDHLIKLPAGEQASIQHAVLDVHTRLERILQLEESYHVRRRVAEALAHSILQFIETARETNTWNKMGIPFSEPKEMDISISNPFPNFRVANGHDSLLLVDRNRICLMDSEDEQIAANVSKLGPISHLLNLAAEYCAKGEVDIDLLGVILCLNHDMYLLSKPDQIMLSKFIERFVAADAAKVAPIVVRRILNRWPYHSSTQQVVVIAQLEACLKVSSPETVAFLLPRIMDCVSKCIIHENCHVANAAIEFAGKILNFVKSSGLNVEKSIDKLRKSLHSNQTHWNPQTRKLSSNLLH